MHRWSSVTRERKLNLSQYHSNDNKNDMELSESFYIFLVTSSAGLLLACLKMCYDSKCSRLDFFCIKIIRDTKTEAESEHDRMEHGILSQSVPQVQPRDQTVDRVPIT